MGVEIEFSTSATPRHTEQVIPIFMALTPVPLAFGYIWRTGVHPEPGVDTGRSRALATGMVIGSLCALVIVGLAREGGFGFVAAFVAVGIVAWLTVALDQGSIGPGVDGGRVSKIVKRGGFFVSGLLMGTMIGVTPWVALFVVLQNS